MPDRIFNRSDRRKATLFVTCLAISAFTWLFYTLSGSYDYDAETAVRYINAPANKAFHPLQPDTVSLKIRGTGWQLLFDKMRLKPEAIDVDMARLGSGNFILFSKQLSELNRQVHSVQQIISVLPDTLYFDFSPRVMKKVPVKLADHLEFRKQFGVSSLIRLDPAFVTVTGPAAEVSKVRYWATDSLVLSGLSRTVHVKVALNKNSSPNIEVFPKVVTAIIPVSEFTEKVMELPVKLINRNNFTVKMLPSVVRITLLSSLPAFHDPAWDKLAAVADLDNWSGKNYTQLPVRLLNVPRFGKVLSIEPQAIDFMVN